MNEWFETHPFLKQMRRRLSVELAVCLLLFCGVFLAARYAGLASAGADAVLGKKKPVVFLDAGHGDFDPGKVSVDGSEGYLDKSQGTMVETVNVTQDPSVSLRQDVVDYALQFVGNPYRYGGSDPNTGVDCSGFTRYVMQNAAGVSLNRSSSSQATQGRTVSAAEMQPGDLIFYGNGSRVNHVAMYIGDGQIVHASTERTGIKVSNWNYRTPVRIASVLG